MSSITPASRDGTPPADVHAVDSEAWRALLGPNPTGTLLRALHPQLWPKDLEGAEYLHRGLARLLREGRGTVDVAEEIRRDLQTGRRRALVKLPDGTLEPLDHHRFQADNSPLLWWTGRADVVVFHGFTFERFKARGIYLAAPSRQPASEPDAAKPVKLTALAETDCAAWLAKQRRTSPDHRPKPRSEFEAEAKALFPGLSGRAFERAWAAEMKGTAWAEGGRPRKTPPQKPPH